MRRRETGDVRFENTCAWAHRASGSTHCGALVAIGLLTTALIIAGCGAGDGTAPETSVEDTAYIDYMAALTLVVEEGKTGEEARARMIELGVQPLSRDEVNQHVDRLSSDPVRWSQLEDQVEERVDELRRGARSGATHQ